MTDISKEAVELMADSLDSQTKAAFGTLSRPAKMLRALSARVQELEAENWRLKREVSHQKMVDKCGDTIGGFDHEALKGDTQ